MDMDKTKTTALVDLLYPDEFFDEEYTPLFEKVAGELKRRIEIMESMIPGLKGQNLDLTIKLKKAEDLVRAQRTMLNVHRERRKREQDKGRPSSVLEIARYMDELSGKAQIQENHYLKDESYIPMLKTNTPATGKVQVQFDMDTINPESKIWAVFLHLPTWRRFAFQVDIHKAVFDLSEVLRDFEGRMAAIIIVWPASPNQEYDSRHFNLAATLKTFQNEIPVFEYGR